MARSLHPSITKSHHKSLDLTKRWQRGAHDRQRGPLCPRPEVDRLHDNIGWGRRGNFVSVPTDSPQHDERLGRRADAQVFLPTACFNTDVSGFFSKWMRDVVDAQSPEGGFSNVAPLLSGVADEGAPGWADAPGRIKLGDWEAQGLAGYSGGVRYRTVVRLSASPAGRPGLAEPGPGGKPGRAELDLGRVRGTAEVTVNGRPAGVRVCWPYVFDLSLDEGENTVEILVLGTLAPYLDAVSPTHFVFPGQRVTGLFGPVLLRT
ncbi:hypothetical protein [Streptosporangium roseum]|uniref:alpha-L-rhamnosidase-related protein n=1 Tax=Streptosporangium roseum TaxID=2001 RepID=UPI00331E1C27